MQQSRRVVLYGSSLFISGLDASLSAVSGLEIRRVEGCGGDTLARVQSCAPDVVVIALGPASGDLVLALLRDLSGIILIGLDPESDRLLVLSAQQPVALGAADLIGIIQQEH